MSVPLGDRAPRVVFVLCTERSGSTLLSAILGSHSRVFAPTEMHMLRFRNVADWRVGYPAAEPSLDSLIQMVGLQLPASLESMTPVAVYREILRHCPPGSLFVDKTPAYAREPAALREAETLGPYYVWLVRHPIPVALSRVERRLRVKRAQIQGMRSRLEYPVRMMRAMVSRWTGSTFRSRVRDWVTMQRNIRAHLERVDPVRWRIVHYEQLVRSPRETVESLCGFLGIEFEPAMLTPQDHAPPGLALGIGDEKFLQHEGIARERADAWRRGYDESLLDPATREFARSLGVEIADP